MENLLLSAAFEALLDALGIGDIDTMVNGRLLWYDKEYYRYTLDVNDRS